MANELFFFYESDLNKSNFAGFFKSLQSTDLKEIFLESTKQDKARWEPGWVLQGYRGPKNNGASGDSEYLAPNAGLQEVRFWWGMTKHVNWIPVAGTLVWITTKIVAGMGDASNWCSLFFDSNTGECLGHTTEVAAVKLNEIGMRLFHSSKFGKAKEYFTNAYKHSNLRTNFDVFRSNIDKAQVALDGVRRAELDEKVRNSHAQGQQGQSIDKNVQDIKKNINDSTNREKCTHSSKNEEKLETKIAKAVIETNALKLNHQGKHSSTQDNFYKDDISEYQVANNTSQTIGKQIINAIDEDKTIIKNKLTNLHILWNNAWKAENDDRFEEAEELFQQVLRESKDGLRIVADLAKFKQYKTLASLKIEGNKLFNEGVVLQQNGLELLQEAYKLRGQQSYKLANSKFHEAKGAFLSAKNVFEIGSKKDPKFASCIDFVQEQLDEVIESIKITEKSSLASGLSSLGVNMSNSKNLEIYSCETKKVNEHIYYAQI